MKKVFAWILVIVLLAGCTNTAAAPTTTAPRPDILDQKQPLDTLGSIFDTGIPMPEGHREPSLYGIGEDLLLLSMDYTDIETCRLLLHRIDTYTGQVVAQTSLATKGFATIQVYGDTVCLCSPPSGKVWLLDGTLTTQAEYSLPESYYDWFVSWDLKKLYQLGWDAGLHCYDLSSGSATELLPKESDVSYRDHSDTDVLFTYVDPDTQMSCTGLLDLETGALKQLANEGSISGYSRSAGVWLSTLPDDEQSCLLGGTGRQTQLFTTPESFSTLTAQGHILIRNYTSGRIDIYNTDGLLVGSVQLPASEYGANGYLSDDMIWDETRGGYFLIYTTFREPEDTDLPEAEPQSDSLLAFLQLLPAREEGQLAMQPYTVDRIPAGSATDQAVFDRAEAIGQRFGVTVLVADQCQISYDDFDAVLVTDAEQIHATLSELERALSAYPEGFFAQLNYGTISNLEFSVVGALTPLREEEYGSTIAAFAQPLEQKYIIVADANIVTDTTFHHELSHVIDRRLDWDASHSVGALYSEDTWASLNPKDFAYDMTYAIHHDRWNYNDAYFMSSYACTYPTEDRATIWEQIMVGNTYPFQNGPMREKLEYYSDCIRDCFDTTGWPEVLPWEEVLR